MDNKVFFHNLNSASVRYSKIFFAKQQKAGASVSDLMRYYDPDVRLPAINLQKFAEKYMGLDSSLKVLLHPRCSGGLGILR